MKKWQLEGVAVWAALFAVWIATGCTGSEEAGTLLGRAFKYPEKTANAAETPRENISRVSLQFRGLQCDRVSAVEGFNPKPISLDDIELSAPVVTLRLPRKQMSKPCLTFFQKERQVGTYEFTIETSHAIETYPDLPLSKTDGPVVFLRDDRVEIKELREDQEVVLSPKDRKMFWNGHELIQAVSLDLAIEDMGLYEIRISPVGTGWVTRAGQPLTEVGQITLENPGNLGLMVSPSINSPTTLRLLRK